MNKGTKKSRGFTIIELLIVIAIIGILATLVITQVSRARVRSDNAATNRNASSWIKAYAMLLNTVNTLLQVSAFTAWDSDTEEGLYLMANVE